MRVSYVHALARFAGLEYSSRLVPGLAPQALRYRLLRRLALAQLPDLVDRFPAVPTKIAARTLPIHYTVLGVEPQANHVSKLMFDSVPNIEAPKYRQAFRV